MEYLKIKKSTFLEIVISALCGMFISLVAVLYLVCQIRTLHNVIKNINYTEHIIVIPQEVKVPAKEEVEIIEKRTENLDKAIAIQNNKRYNLNKEDRELLAKLLYCEGRGESVDCQRAIISVVINRLNNGYWGTTIKDVVYAKGQFSPVSSGAINKAKPSQTQYDVVDYVLENGTTLPSWVMYFRASYHFNWKGYTPYCAIDNTYFGGMK